MYKNKVVIISNLLVILFLFCVPFFGFRQNDVSMIDGNVNINNFVAKALEAPVSTRLYENNEESRSFPTLDLSKSSNGVQGKLGDLLFCVWPKGQAIIPTKDLTLYIGFTQKFESDLVRDKLFEVTISCSTIGAGRAEFTRSIGTEDLIANPIYQGGIVPFYKCFGVNGDLKNNIGKHKILIKITSIYKPNNQILIVVPISVIRTNH